MPGIDDRFSDASDPVTGEAVGPVAADGTRRHPAARTAGQLFAMLGDFEPQLMQAISDAICDMDAQGSATDRKVKGSIKIALEVTRDSDGIYFVTPSYDVKVPRPGFGRSIAWLTDDGHLSPNKPQQGNLFGGVRVIDGAAREIRN